MIRKTRAKALGAWTNSAFWMYLATLAQAMSWKVALPLALTLCLSVTQGAQLLILVPLMQLAGLDVQQGSIAWLAELVSSIFGAIGVRPTLITVLAAFVLFSIGLALITRWQMTSNFKLQQDFVASLRGWLYRAIAHTSWLTFSRSRSSDFTHALTTELDRVGQGTFYLLRLVTSSILLCVYVLLALRLSVLLTALVFVSGGGLLLLLKSKARKAHGAGEDVSLATNSLYAAAIEHLAGMKTAKSYGVEERNADIFSKLSDRVAHMHLNGTRNLAGTSFWFSAGSVVTLSVILFVAVEILEISTAELLFLLFLFYRIIPLFNQGQQSYQQFLNALPAFGRVMEVQARCEAAAEPKAERSERVELRQGIRFEGVSFAYEEGGKPLIISDLDLSVRAGETTAIVGPSGAGKSTVADLVMGLIVPGSGEVLVDEKPLSAERMRGWRGQIGYVVQDTFLFHDTVRANLLWAYPDASDEEMREALRLAAAEDFVLELPKGMETILGDRGVRLSGGERQRLALARALLRKPSLLILDEATSNLDSENETRIQHAIEKLHGSMTILIITHRLFAVRSADIIHVLEQGRLVESGDPYTLLARKNGRFLTFFKAQSTDTGAPLQ